MKHATSLFYYYYKQQQKVAGKRIKLKVIFCCTRIEQKNPQKQNKKFENLWKLKKKVFFVLKIFQLLN